MQQAWSCVGVAAFGLLVAGCGGGGGGGGGGGAPSTGGNNTPTGTALAASRVGPAGGTVTGGGVTLQVPPGALSQDVEISITQGTDVDMTRLPGGIPARPAGQAFRFEPSGLRFAVPATATVPSSGSNDLIVALRDDRSGAIELLRPTPANGGLQVQLDHFSTSQPAASQAPPPTVTSMTPTSGPIDTLVTITGTNFRTGSPPLEVFFGSTRAAFANIVTSTIVAAAPSAPEHATQVIARVPLQRLSSTDIVTVRNTDGLSATSGAATFSYQAGAAHHMNSPTGAITVAPGQPFTVVVHVEDQNSALVPSATNVITLQANVQLSGVLTQTAAGGVATFPGISITSAGQHHLAFTSPGLPGSTGACVVTVQAGQAAKVRFIDHLAGTYAGVPLMNQNGSWTSLNLRTELTDAFDNPVPGALAITLELTGVPGALQGNLTATSDASGRAAFPGPLRIEAPTGTYTLTARGPGLTPGTSLPIVVNGATPRWLDAGATPTPHANAAAAAGVGADRRIYVGGTDTGTTSVVEAYDVDARAWTTLPPLPLPRRWFAMASLQDGRILVLGGVDGSGAVVGTVEAFDPVAGTWTTLASMARARALFTAGTLNDGTLLVLGGIQTLSQAVGNRVLERFDPAAGTWADEGIYPALSTPLSASAAVGADGRFHFRLPVAVRSYDPTLRTWNSETYEPVAPTRDGGSATAPDGRMYTVGNHSYGVTSAAFDPATATFTAAPGLRTPRSRLGMVRGPDGRLYAIGGNFAPWGVEVFGPTFTLSPATGAPGTTVTLTGSNFGQSGALDVRWGTATGTLLTSGATDAAGRVTGTVTFTVPAVAPGTYTVTALDNVAGYPVNVTFVVP